MPTPYLDANKTPLTKPIYFLHTPLCAKRLSSRPFYPSSPLTKLPPLTKSPQISRSISLTRSGTMDKTLITNRLSDQPHKRTRHLFQKGLFFAQFPNNSVFPLTPSSTLNLLEMAMTKCHPKGLKVKPLRDFRSLPEAFSFRG